MNITQYKVTEIIYPDSKYKLAHPGRIDDEGSFYRVDSTHIFDKVHIKSMKIIDHKLTIQKKDMVVLLVVENK